MELTREERALIAVNGLDTVKTFCLRALETKVKGTSAHYTHIVTKIISQDEPDTLVSVLVALSSCISVIMRSPEDYVDLINAVFSYKWQSDKRVSIAVVFFIGHIISSDVTFAIPAFEKLVSNFCAMSGTISVEASDFIHRTIRGILNLSPASFCQLPSILIKSFPHKRFSLTTQSIFVSELLKMCSYSNSQIQFAILDLIVSKCLEIDVEIVIEDGGEVAIRADSQAVSHDDMFQLDLEEDRDTDNSMTHNQNSFQQETMGQRIPQDVIEMAEKLDAMLLLLLEFVEKELKNEKNRSILIDQLFQIFERRILATHKSKFVQYILFFLCSQDELVSHKFAERLFAIFVDEDNQHNSPLRKQSAIMYLASYLSRAKHISSSFVSDMLEDIVTWCGIYVDAQQDSPAPHNVNGSLQQLRSSPSKPCGSSCSVVSDATDTSNIDFPSTNFIHRHILPLSGSKSTALQNSNVNSVSSGNALHHTLSSHSLSLLSIEENWAHETFYCAVEAACYILCFHGPEMMEIHCRTSYLKDDWYRIVSHSLHPLRYCLQTVRIEFLKLSLHMGLFCESFWNNLSPDILYSQNHHKIHALNSGLNPLDSFFPFDPCLLRRMQSRIENDYRAWISPIFEDESQSIEDSEDDGNMNDFNMVDGRSRALSIDNVASDPSSWMPLSYSQSMSLSASAMSISPSMASLASSLALPYGEMEVGSSSSSINPNGMQNSNLSSSVTMSSSIPGESLLRYLHNHHNQRRTRRSSSLSSEMSDNSITINPSPSSSTSNSFAPPTSFNGNFFSNSNGSNRHPSGVAQVGVDDSPSRIPPKVNGGVFTAPLFPSMGVHPSSNGMVETTLTQANLRKAFPTSRMPSAHQQPHEYDDEDTSMGRRNRQFSITSTDSW